MAPSAPSIVVLTDAPHTRRPGWVYAEETEPLRANALVRGVFAPAGRHALCFAFRPTRLATGLAVPSAAGLGWIATVGAPARGRARNRARALPRGGRALALHVSCAF